MQQMSKMICPNAGESKGATATRAAVTGAAAGKVATEAASVVAAAEAEAAASAVARDAAATAAVTSTNQGPRSLQARLNSEAPRLCACQARARDG